MKRDYSRRDASTEGGGAGGVSWLLALVLAVLVSSATAAAAWIWFTPEFKSFTMLRVAAKQPTLFFATVENSEQQTFNIYKCTQAELMRSRFVLNSALRSPEIQRLPAVREQEDAVAWLENRVSVEFPGQSELMKISVRHGDAETAAALANAVTKAYMREVVDVERRHRMDKLSSLEKVFNDSEEKMLAKRADLKRLAHALGTNDNDTLTSKEQATLQHLAALRNEHMKLQLELMRARFTLAELEQAPSGLTLAEADEQKNAAAQPKSTDKESSASLKHRVAILTAMEKALNENVQKYSKDVEPIGHSSIELDMMRSDLEQLEKLCTDLGKEIDFQRVELRSPSRVIELQTAEIPLTRDMEAWTENAGIAAVLGFLLPLMAVSIWNSLAQQRTQGVAGGVSETGSGEASRNEILVAIERLGDLKAKGILSEDEFASKKAELLARL